MNEPIHPFPEESAYATGETRIFRLACPGCDPGLARRGKEPVRLDAEAREEYMPGYTDA